MTFGIDFFSFSDSFLFIFNNYLFLNIFFIYLFLAGHAPFFHFISLNRTQLVNFNFTIILVIIFRYQIIVLQSCKENYLIKHLFFFKEKSQFVCDAQPDSFKSKNELKLALKLIMLYAFLWVSSFFSPFVHLP
jgi:hypothetical protein